jgi:hypothetical protein
MKDIINNIIQKEFTTGGKKLNEKMLDILEVKLFEMKKAIAAKICNETHFTGASTNIIDKRGDGKDQARTMRAQQDFYDKTMNQMFSPKYKEPPHNDSLDNPKDPKQQVPVSKIQRAKMKVDEDKLQEFNTLAAQTVGAGLSKNIEDRRTSDPVQARVNRQAPIDTSGKSIMNYISAPAGIDRSKMKVSTQRADIQEKNK